MRGLRILRQTLVEGRNNPVLPCFVEGARRPVGAELEELRRPEVDRWVLLEMNDNLGLRLFRAGRFEGRPVRLIVGDLRANQKRVINSRRFERIGDRRLFRRRFRRGVQNGRRRAADDREDRLHEANLLVGNFHRGRRNDLRAHELVIVFDDVVRERAVVRVELPPNKVTIGRTPLGPEPKRNDGILNGRRRPVIRQRHALKLVVRKDVLEGLVHVEARRPMFAPQLFAAVDHMHHVTTMENRRLGHVVEGMFDHTARRHKPATCDDRWRCRLRKQGLHREGYLDRIVRLELREESVRRRFVVADVPKVEVRIEPVLPEHDAKTLDAAREDGLFRARAHLDFQGADDKVVEANGLGCKRHV